MGRLASLALRSGIKIEDVIRQLKGIRCPSTIRQPGLNVLSCPDAIAKVLRQTEEAMQKEKGIIPAINERKKEPGEITYEASRMKFCPECGAPVIHEGGCVICPECGFSKCG